MSEICLYEWLIWNIASLQVEGQLQADWYLLVRDIYAFYPLLIKYVDLQRNHWLRHNVPESEELYGCVAEIFNMWSISGVCISYFRKKTKLYLAFLSFLMLFLFRLSTSEKKSKTSFRQTKSTTWHWLCQHQLAAKPQSSQMPASKCQEKSWVKFILL